MRTFTSSLTPAVLECGRENTAVGTTVSSGNSQDCFFFFFSPAIERRGWGFNENYTVVCLFVCFLIMEISLLTEKLDIEEDKENNVSYFHQPKGPC